MLGDWRMGKTDTSLLIGHLGRKWKLIDKIGSNIWTFNNPEVAYITNLGHLRKWLHADKATKLFIFDEGLAHIPRRTAMSQKNIGLLKLLAELSKGHARMIICSQIAKIDSDILNPAFTRAVFIKRSKKVMDCRSKHFAPRTFTGLPRSPIRFDPDRLAPFIDREMSKKVKNFNGNKDMEIIEMHVRGITLQRIGDHFNMSYESVRRILKKGLREFLELKKLDVDEGEEFSEKKEIAVDIGNP